jgi:hypothetical protein
MIAVTPIAAPTDVPVGYPSDTPTASLPTETTEPVVQAPPGGPTSPLAPIDTVAPTVILPTATSLAEASAANGAPQSDPGSYVLFAVAVVGLGGWLLVSRLRK